MKQINLKQILAAMERNKYSIFQSHIKPYNLNLVGIRSSDSTPNIFNDQFWAFWPTVGGNWEEITIPITTEPGIFYLLNLVNPKGAAILKPGQYKGIWKIGLHQGKYEALVQHGPCTVIRDFNRDWKYDYNSGREDTGSDFGINFHHAGEDSKTVDNWSAGCQVTEIIKDFDAVMKWARLARSYWGNSFTYTLLLEGQI